MTKVDGCVGVDISGCRSLWSSISPKYLNRVYLFRIALKLYHKHSWHVSWFQSNMVLQ
jgi:hypothetical protein